MAPKAHTYCIAGAGIAGMTLALVLAKHGANVVVLEKNSHIQEVGAGLQISPNAGKILRDLGLDSQMEKAGFEPEGIDVYPFRAQKPVVTLALGQQVTNRYAHPYRVIHRADLAGILHTACRRFANIDIRFDVSGFEVTSQGSDTTVNFNTFSGPETLRCHAFIGADGVGSPTRQKLLGGVKPIDTTLVAWRTLIPLGRLSDHFHPNRTSLVLGPGIHAVIYPLAARGETNIALFAPHDPVIPSNEPYLPQKVRTDPRFAAILAASYDWTYWPLAAIKTPHWHKGRIGLIGDAAHAMLPFQAQGAAMAIEDAMTLGGLLESVEEPEAAFSKYEDIRRTRVEKVAHLSQRNGRIFHLTGPIEFARNLVLRAGGATSHFRRLDWIYSYTPPVESRMINNEDSA